MHCLKSPLQYVYNVIYYEPKEGHDIDFNAAMLEKQGCSFQSKYLFSMLYKIYVRFIECPVTQ